MNADKMKEDIKNLIGTITLDYFNEHDYLTEAFKRIDEYFDKLEKGGI